MHQIYTLALDRVKTQMLFVEHSNGNWGKLDQDEESIMGYVFFSWGNSVIL